jgi:hypothetical protein
MAGPSLVSADVTALIKRMGEIALAVSPNCFQSASIGIGAAVMLAFV